jgi:hypothetical protein
MWEAEANEFSRVAKRVEFKASVQSVKLCITSQIHNCL